jgi:metacaspase-1
MRKLSWFSYSLSVVKYLTVVVLCLSLKNIAWANYQKRALIIAVGTYKAQSAWNRLASVTDLILMKEMLLKQQFPVANILTIQDSEATKAGIKRKFLQLIASANIGDKIVIHFSGHGQQVSDLNGDEADNLDEALVPYDAPSEWKDPQYRFDKHITDDEINDWIEQLKIKIGKEGHILLILDSCHSGTASRGQAAVRGHKAPLILAQNQEKIITYNSQGSDYFESSNKASEGKFVMLTATTASQVNYQTKTTDGKDIGSLTYAVVKAFQNIQKEASYQNLFTSVSNNLHAMQQPQTPTIEGDINAQVFDGQYVVQEPVYSMKQIIEHGKTVLKVSSGYLSNIFEGTKFDLLPKKPSKNKGNEVIAKARVISSNSFESIIEIYEGVISPQMTDLLAQQTEQALEKYDVRIRIENFQYETLKRVLEDDLKKAKLITIDPQNADLIVSEEKDSVAIKIVATGEIYTKIIIDKNTQRAVKESIIDFCRANMLSSLTINNPDFSSQIILKHATLKNHQPIFWKDSVEVYPTFAVNQSGWLIIRNTGKSDFYFTLFDIQPNGKINIILPDEAKGFGNNEVRIPSGKEKGFPISKFSPPLGIEKFKIIMTDAPANFSFLSTQSRNLLSNKKNNLLENLFKDFEYNSIKNNSQRGSEIITVPTIGGTASFTFRIIN